MIKITILTPTYNRSKLLRNTYTSLVKQTNHDFEWLVIDDGSSDDTKEVVEGFINEKKIRIIYKQKPNGGKHTALNYSHPYISGDYVIILDDDDMLTPDAIDTVIGTWDKYGEDSHIACLSFVKGRSEIQPISDWVPSETTVSNHIDYRINNNRMGDCAEVIRSDVFKEFPFPEYPGEKFLAEGYLWISAGYKYNTVYLNKIIYLCDYLEGGLTKAGKKMRLANPKGGMHNCRMYFNKRISLKQQLKHAILYDSYALADGNFLTDINKTNRKIMCYATLPIGFLLYKKWNK